MGYMRVNDGITTVNIGKFWKVSEKSERSERVYRLWEVSHLVKQNVSRIMHSKSCLGTPWGASYECICESMYPSKGGIG